MLPFYFGISDKRLYGVYHEASGNEFRDEAILICYSSFHEYMRTHWFFKLLCDKLAARGFHCLRFDYMGTGDSSGSLLQADMDTWVKNIEVAVDELKALSGCSRVSVIGVRLGAMLAAIASREISIEKLILWDPVLDGAVYYEEMKNLHNEMICDSRRFKSLPSSINDDGAKSQVLGYEVSENFVTSLIKSKIEPSEVESHDLFFITEIKSKIFGSECDHKENCKSMVSGVKAGWNSLAEMEQMFFSEKLNKLIIDTVCE